MNSRYPQVAAQANHACEYCHAPEWVFNFPLEVEHIVPVCRGRLNELNNLALSCRSCNLRKGTHTQFLDPITKREVSLFHPRTMQWHNHFSVNSGTGEIEGKTAIGRGTVLVLQINSANQLKARKLWVKLGLFP